AEKLSKELLRFERYLGFPLIELPSWPDEEVVALFLARLVLLWRRRFPSLETDPLVGPHLGLVARDALVQALSRRAAILRSNTKTSATGPPHRSRLAYLFEEAAGEFRRSFDRMREAKARGDDAGR